MDQVEKPDEIEKKKATGSFSIRLPKSLHAELTRQAKSEGVSLNQHISTLLSIVVSGGKKITRS